MSNLLDVAVACPRCQTSNNSLVADAINADRAPELRQQILERKLHVVGCRGCGESFAVEKVLLYTDFRRAQWIGVFPGVDEAQFETCERIVDDSFRKAMREQAPNVVKGWAESFRVRVVFSMPQLREKLLCWEEGMDDRVLELVKLDLMGARPELVLYGVKSWCLEAITPEGWLFTPIRHTPTRDPTAQGCVVPRTVIDRVAATADTLREAHAALWQGPYVSIQRYTAVNRSGT